jgi:hypothetical protein
VRVVVLVVGIRCCSDDDEEGSPTDSYFPAAVMHTDRRCCCCCCAVLSLLLLRRSASADDLAKTPRLRINCPLCRVAFRNYHQLQRHPTDRAVPPVWPVVFLGLVGAACCKDRNINNKKEYKVSKIPPGASKGERSEMNIYVRTADPVQIPDCCWI